MRILLELFLLLSFQVWHIVVQSQYCENTAIIDVPLKSGDGSIYGKLFVNLADVDNLLSYGLQVSESIDSQTAQRIAVYVQERLEVLRFANRSFVEPAVTVDDYLKTIKSVNFGIIGDVKHVNKSPYDDTYFLTSRKLNRLQDHRLITAESKAVGQNDVYKPLLSKEMFHTDKQRSSIKIYQTINAFTGGTTAMRTLSTTLKELGFPTILCNDSNINSSECNAPTERDIAVTGEWCQPVIDEYLSFDSSPRGTSTGQDSSGSSLQRKLSSPRKFYGRGIQYFLGFHHGRDECRGWITAADSQFIYNTLVHRGMHAYYLGCVMSETIEDSFRELNNREIERSHGIGRSCAEIQKEKLILVDADFFDDYQPTSPVQFELPEGYSFIILRGFSADEGSLLLKRAQIVLDLAMPGPERISSEAILFGAIPIIAERWNGASDVDFPGLFRVDANNGTSIASVLQYVANNYHNLIEDHRSRAALGQQDIHIHRFWRYITSMQTRSQRTVDAYFSSMYIHFVLDTTLPLYFGDGQELATLQRETAAVFQTVALLYLHPLASIEIIVHDTFWFHRHHYVFLDYLRQAGYLRVDPMDPREYQLLFPSSSSEKTPSIHSRTSFVRIRSAYESSKARTTSKFEAEDVGSRDDRAWDMIHVSVSPGYIFRKPGDLYSIIRQYITSPSSLSTLHAAIYQHHNKTSSPTDQREYVVVKVAGPAFPSGDIFYQDNSQGTVAEETYEAQSIMNICHLLQARVELLDEQDEELELVRGVSETLIWQMLVTNYQQQLRSSLYC